LLTGALALAQSAEPTLKQLRAEAPLHAAALLGAAAGAAQTAWAPEAWIRLWIGLIALGSGAYNLWALFRVQHSTHRDASARWPEPRTLAGIGLVVGLGSAFSGTGGPLLLLPCLLAGGYSVARSVRCALAIQVPIALAATGTHWLAGRLDLALGFAVAAILVPCAWLGQRLALRASDRRLRQMASSILIGTGLWLVFV
jgi:hypothetical protein